MVRCSVCKKLGHTKRNHERIMREGVGPRCNQCNERLPKGETRKNCPSCRKLMTLHYSHRQEYLRRRPVRRGLDPNGRLRVRLNRISANRKTGPIPVTMSSSSTCPPTCGFFGAGCYAEFGPMRNDWSRTPEQGLTWEAFCTEISKLPEGAIWRHAQAGDLPGKGLRLDVPALRLLVAANAVAHARGFTYTHKPLDRPEEIQAVRQANQYGFTVNLSADSLEHADELLSLDAGPVVAVIESSSTALQKTPGGATVVHCPYETHEIQCVQCKLCAVPTRKSVVVFRAHGQMREVVDDVVSTDRLVRKLKTVELTLPAQKRIERAVREMFT